MRVYGFRHKPTGDIMHNSAVKPIVIEGIPWVCNNKEGTTILMKHIASVFGHLESDLEIVAFDLTEVQET